MKDSEKKSAPIPSNPVRQAVWGVALLFTGSVCLASLVHPHMDEFQRRSSHRDDPLTGVLGEGRKLFANHFYVKADAYFHSGYYPTIFDNRESHVTPHIAEDAGVREGKNTGDEDHFLGDAANWIDSHGRKHFPSVHTHLGEDNPGHEQAGPGHDDGGVEREILPWLKLSAKLDPNLVETYTVAAFWLRDLKKFREAELFLREGMNANPESVEILFELGRCRFDADDMVRARNIWERCWDLWQGQELGKEPEQQNRFLSSQILLNLARLESRVGNKDKCLQWLETGLPLAINADKIRERMEDVKAGRPFESEKKE